MSFPILHLSSLRSCPVDCGGRIINAPLFLVDAFNIISRNIANVGIFRTAGQLKRVKQLKCTFFGEEKIPENSSVNDVCDAVKSFLRDLDEPLLTSALEQQFLRFTSTISREDVRTRSILQLCRVLSPRHRETLAFLMWQLKKISDRCHENKMTISNLALVMSLSIFRGNGAQIRGKVQDAKMDTALKASVIEMLIKHAEDICGLAKRSELLPSEKEKFLSSRGKFAVLRKPRMNTIVGTADLQPPLAAQVDRMRRLSGGTDENVPELQSSASAKNEPEHSKNVGRKQCEKATNTQICSPFRRVVLRQKQEGALMNISADAVPRTETPRELKLLRAASDANERPIETPTNRRRRSVDTQNKLKRGQPNTVRSGLDKTKGKFVQKELHSRPGDELAYASLPNADEGEPAGISGQSEEMLEATSGDSMEERDDFADCERHKVELLRLSKQGSRLSPCRAFRSPSTPARERPSIAHIKSCNRGRVLAQAAKYETVIQQQHSRIALTRPKDEAKTLTVPTSVPHSSRRSPMKAHRRFS